MILQVTPWDPTFADTSAAAEVAAVAVTSMICGFRRCRPTGWGHAFPEGLHHSKEIQAIFATNDASGQMTINDYNCQIYIN